RVGHIHRKISVLLQELEDTGQVARLERENGERAARRGFDEALVGSRPETRGQQVTRLRHDWPCRHERLTQRSERILRSLVVTVPCVCEREPIARVGDNHPRLFFSRLRVSSALYDAERFAGPRPEPTKSDRSSAAPVRASTWSR